MKPLSELSDEELAVLAGSIGHALPDAPQWLVESAVGMWRVPAPAAGLRQRIVALLGFDSWAAAPTTLAMRSAPPAVRQLLFTAGERDVDVRISPAEGLGPLPRRFTVAGQVLGPGDNGLVTLVHAQEPPRSVPLDEYGEFRFADVPPGASLLVVQIGEDRIELPELHVGAESSAG
jgi:hypothetical protein